MKKLILFFLASIVLISCNKKVTLKGRVLNPVTNQGIEGFTIAVSADTWELPGGAKPVGQTTSGADGSFVLEFKRSGYDFSVYKEGYYNIGWYQNGEILPGQLSVKDKGKNMKADFYAVPYGELNLDIKNINCEGIADIMWLRKKWQYDEGYGAWPQLSREGCYQNLTGASTVPVGEYIYQIKVQRASGDIIMEFPGIVYENQLTTFEIYY